MSTYLNRTHLYSRIANLLAMAVMLGIPAIICTVYHIWPTFTSVLATAGPLLAMFVPSALSEVVSFTPITGSSGYIAAIMGNVSNIKFPCAIAAMERTNSLPGTEQGDVIATCAMCISGIVTTVIIAVGVVLLVPLQPLLTSGAVTTATHYIMPALFGSLAISFFMNSNAGAYTIHGKMKLSLTVLILMLALFLLFPGLVPKQGYVLLCSIPVIILLARIFYKKGIVTVTER
jgi:hypothetical protein